MPFAIAALLAWSAFSFGAVYAWSYLPLAAGMVAVGAVVLATSRRSLSFGLPVAAAVGVGAAVAVQLVPVTPASVGAPHHGLQMMLSAIDVGYANGVTRAHSMS